MFELKAVSRLETLHSPSDSDVTAITFGGHAGALHRPPVGDSRGVAVLLCAPLGREARSAYRPLFLWAQSLAAQGFPVLRYDHLGEGDSLDLDPYDDQWARWLTGVAQAAAFTRTHTGCRGLVLAGLRSGATLALAAAGKIRPEGLLLMAPFPSGEAWIRDLRLAAAVANAPLPLDGALEVDGLRLSPAGMRSIEAVDLGEVAPTWQAAFLAGTASARGMAAKLGPRVTQIAFEGYGRLFKDAHVNEAPARVFERATAWLNDFAADADTPSAAPDPPPAQLSTAAWVERPVAFGEGLRGILCLPTSGSDGRAVIFGNTGAEPRAGVGAFTTRACRALAGAGVASLRFDFRGLGESEAGAEWRSHVYETDRLGDFRSAAEVLRREGRGEITLAGVCTGGFHAVRAVIDGEEFRHAIAINAWLVWRPGRQLELRSETAQGRPRRAAPIEGRPKWRRLLHGDLDLREALARRARQLRSSTRPDAPCRAARRDIRNAARRGARLDLIVGLGDAALNGLEADFGFRCGWLSRQPGATVSLIPDLEHALFSVRSQRKAMHELFRRLDLAPPAAGARIVAVKAEGRARASDEPDAAAVAVASVAVATLSLIVFAAAGVLRLRAPGLFDHPVTLALNGLAHHSTAKVDLALRALDAFKTFHIVPVMGLAYGAFVATRSAGRRAALVAGGAAALVAALLCCLAQQVTPQLPRPIFDASLPFRPPTGADLTATRDWSSFPSTHAAIIWGVAAATLIARRAFGWIAVAIAAIWSVLTLYGGLFYPSDILGGGALAIALVGLTAAAVQRRTSGLSRLGAAHPALIAAACFLLAQVAALFDDARLVATSPPTEPRAATSPSPAPSCGAASPGASKTVPAQPLRAAHAGP